MFGPQDPQEVVGQYKLERDSRSPHIRILIIENLLRAGVTENTLAIAQEMAEWIGADFQTVLDEYISIMELAKTNTNMIGETVVEDQTNKGYYL